MIQTACPSPDWHHGFLAMLPIIVSHAKFAFRRLRPEALAEAVQEVVANCCRAYARLVELNKLSLAYPRVLANYGVRQTLDHRRVGGRLNCKDVLSGYCQRLKGIVVERLDRFDEQEDAWQEVVIEDKTAGPFDIARTRIDFDAWLRHLPHRNRRIAKSLALGNNTTDVAERFDLSPGRISRLRKELAESWRKFVGDEDGNETA
jgi:hypothetical protein